MKTLALTFIALVTLYAVVGTVAGGLRMGGGASPESLKVYMGR